MRDAKVRSASHGVRKPGVWAPWPGATMTSTRPLCRSGGPWRASTTHETGTWFFVGFLQGLATAGLPPQRQRDPQRKGVPGVPGREADEIVEVLEAVADGVVVNERQPSRGLDRAPGHELRCHRLDQSPARVQ